MAIIEKDGFVFDVDVEKTKKYYKSEINLCECGYCRNFYAQAKSFSREIEAFLAEFGADIEKLDTVSNYDTKDNKICYYLIGFTVNGEIKNINHCELEIGEFEVIFGDGSNTSDYFPNSQKDKKIFFISIDGPVLPWVLDEPM